MPFWTSNVGPLTMAVSCGAISGEHDWKGVLRDFYACGFVITNEKRKIRPWETHVSPECNDFLDVVLWTHGPYKNGANEHMNAVSKKTKE